MSSQRQTDRLARRQGRGPAPTTAPGLAALAAAVRVSGDPETYKSEVLHSEPDGSFSIVALVWRPGQVTPIHDHVTWCVFGVIRAWSARSYSSSTSTAPASSRRATA
jgi:predicted metal-dependent enzyme (double-stranded beta helix superfamily)